MKPRITRTLTVITLISAMLAGCTSTPSINDTASPSSEKTSTPSPSATPLPDDCGAPVDPPTEGFLRVADASVTTRQGVNVLVELTNTTTVAAVNVPFYYRFFIDDVDVSADLGESYDKHYNPVIIAFVPTSMPFPNSKFPYENTAWFIDVPESWKGKDVTVRPEIGEPEGWCVDNSPWRPPTKLDGPPDHCTPTTQTTQLAWDREALTPNPEHDNLRFGATLTNKDPLLVAWNVNVTYRIMHNGRDVTADIDPDLPEQLTDLIAPIVHHPRIGVFRGRIWDPPTWAYDANLTIDATVTVEGWCEREPGYEQ
jgi:hypothetical protein